MNGTKSHLIVLALVATVASISTANAADVTHENGIYYLEVSGTPYEAGVQHGEALSKEIQKAIADYKANVAKMFGEDDAEKILEWALKTAKFRADLEKYVPDLVEEAKGIADGAGVTTEDILMLGMYEEVYEAGPHKIGIMVLVTTSPSSALMIRLYSGRSDCPTCVYWSV